jgi:aquaporin Z
MKYVYEFIGTFFLVFTVGMTVLEPHSAKDFAPLAIGSVLAVMIFAGGHVSGAHYNPAVSFAVFLRGKLPFKDLIVYWIFQLVAAIAAAYLTMYLKGNPLVQAQHLDPIRALVAEFVFTFALCHVMLNVATAKETEGNSYYGLAIGFTVLVGAYAVGTVSGGAFNPAVALGMSFMKLSFWSDIWIFIAATFTAGALAAWVFRLTHQES